MKTCPKCERKKRVKTSIIKVKGKKYWVSKCVTCETPLEMEEKDAA